MILATDTASRVARARLSLDGLSVGDAFGSALGEYPASVGPSATQAEVVQDRWLRERRAPPDNPWPTTDDTEMGLAVVETLEKCGAIDPDELAERFGARFDRDPQRGYGGTARRILGAIAQGQSWRKLAPAVFNGKGSMGNGSAMRAMPIGAYFAEDPARVVAEAKLSAAPTHANPEGESGAVAAALGAAWAARRAAGTNEGSIFDFVLAELPMGLVREGVEQAKRLGPSASTFAAVQTLGSGQQVLSHDTVPFCLWCVAREPGDFAAALWRCADGYGDRDTTCAIVGGIVALSAGSASIPPAWLAAREALRATYE
jgi:ADP-ribosylglycohydrolase